MKRFATFLVPALWFALILTSCGGSADSTNSSAGSGAGKPSSASSASSSGGLAAVSKYDAGPRAGETPADHEKAEQGEKLFSSKGCTACHGFGRRLTGPDLAGVSMRRTAVWIENQILHPDVMVKEDPIAHELFAQFALQMPKQGLTPEEARAVIEYFKEQDRKSAAGHGDDDESEKEEER